MFHMIFQVLGTFAVNEINEPRKIVNTYLVQKLFEKIQKIL